MERRGKKRRRREKGKEGERGIVNGKNLAGRCTYGLKLFQEGFKVVFEHLPKTGPRVWSDVKPNHI